MSLWPSRHLAVVVGASIEMEQGASALGRHYAVANVVTGGLVLAAVTSLPNAVAAVYLGSRGRGAAALSTALNSNTLGSEVPCRYLTGEPTVSARARRVTLPEGPGQAVRPCHGVGLPTGSPFSAWSPAPRWVLWTWPWATAASWLACSSRDPAVAS
jgi:hypothetical protein